MVIEADRLCCISDSCWRRSWFCACCCSSSCVRSCWLLSKLWESPGGAAMLKGTGSGAPTKDDVKSLASAETARLRLRRAALCGASMASELLVAKHTKETAHSSRTKESFQLYRGKTKCYAFRPPRGSSGNCLEIEKPSVHHAVSDVRHIPAQGPVNDIQ